MTRCFVTGGTGFIGSHLVRLLSDKKHEVSILARESSKMDLIEGIPVSVIKGDVTDLTSLINGVPEDTEWFFHNAAIMTEWGSESRTFPVNVDGTRNVLEALRKKDIPNFIFTSSTAVYGFPNQKEPLLEDASWNPINAYQRSKAAAEKLVRQYASDYGIKATFVRPPTVLGHGDMYTGPQLISRLMSEGMVVFGGGDNLHSFVHGEDVAGILIAAAENMSKSVGRAYNAVSFHCEFKTFVGALADELGVPRKFQNIPYIPALAMAGIMGGLYRAFHRKKPPLITTFRVKLFGSNYDIDGSRAHDELGYEVNWDLQSTVKDMVDWGGEVKAR
ncbi:MAG: NAD-dependent epimerase/dehydratase family protein [Candidatus Thorarchaeota archaeon]